MNALSRAQQAYAAASAPVRTPKNIEYQVISRITRNMRDADRKGRAGFPALASALHENRQLWTLFAIDLSGDGNGLPRDLRARLLSLAEFTQHHTSRVLAREATVEPLLEVNTAVMRGLRTGAA
ncbi:flagellar protein FlaF [Cribrihabitans marinus]|uniref:Flagellar protein FlaF n=1 Tax=Cribrihabitans marinus TaxID=1227549 RepID=A0A1H6XRA0_9RHOB|nr:flagellar biosynthesis regulator FlaF [Cribrihabitans marinus]GGH27913.1 flagellar biosynthesis regulatory protein FlaF [Cribrihabitans marinus]SEJ31569.1 flagellar protein FlaF [Cribrihabitans marinus]